MAALNTIQQFGSFIEKAKKVLILIPQNPEGDAIGSAWAFYFYLKNKGIYSDVAFSSNPQDIARFAFLPKPENIRDNIDGNQDFVLSFNTKYKNITNVKTERKKDEFWIYVTPEKGGIDPRDFSFLPSKFKYDVLVVLDSPDKESTGKIFEDNPDIFYEVPIVNIDHHSDNDNFGQVNLVNVKASSTAEVLAEIFEKENPQAINEDIANCLLVGIISATDSFQKKNTTPKSLQMASRLIERGANQQRISRYLYKNQPFKLLKLWGRVMTRLNLEEDIKLVWSTVSIEDFIQSRTTPKDVPLILKKIKDNYSSGNYFVLFYGAEKNIVRGFISFENPSDEEKIISVTGGKREKNLITFECDGSDMNNASREIIEKLKKILS